MSKATTEMTRWLAAELSRRGDPEIARGMAAYMKTDMPFHGVKKPERLPVLRELKKRYAPADARAYEETVLALWQGKHREEKYAALYMAMAFRKLIDLPAMPLYERLIREGAWWDLVDDVAIRLVGEVWRKQRARVSTLMDRWIDDEDLWIRRTAIIGQNKHGEDTDEKRLFDYCARRMHEKEFFIRKGIGWALRSYAYTAPKAVASFLRTHKDGLSGLSYREASKHL
ncbi:MAG: DNA alkylation repair protein [Myxococcota bacterium]